MRPYIICHMLSSVDGKIDGAALDAVTGDGEYEATGAKLNGDAWICGRTTMQQHFAEDEPFVSASNTPAGPRPVFVGVSPTRNTAVPLSLKSVEQRERDALWIRYEMVRSETAERRNNAKA